MPPQLGLSAIQRLPGLERDVPLENRGFGFLPALEADLSDDDGRAGDNLRRQIDACD